MNAIQKLEWIERVLTTIAVGEDNIKRMRIGIRDVRDNIQDWLEENQYANEFEVDYPTLSRHKPQSQIEDSRAAAGLPGGGAFTPTVTTLPHRAHGHEEGCECETCTWIQEAYARGDALRQVETF